ncbi:MAG: DUF5063 domain-containing protein [Planctomycetota bacterium]
MNNQDSKIEANLTAVREFAQAAQEYCLILENNLQLPNDDFLKKIADSLSLLYFRASALPNVEPPEKDSVIDKKFISEQAKTLQEKLWDKLGKKNVYWEVWDPYQLGKDDPMQTTLSDDLADIYSEVKGSLEIYNLQTKNSILEATFVWRNNFEHHWGQHLVDALKAIYRLLYGGFLEGISDWDTSPTSNEPRLDKLWD